MLGSSVCLNLFSKHFAFKFLLKTNYAVIVTSELYLMSICIIYLIVDTTNLNCLVMAIIAGFMVNEVPILQDEFCHSYDI